MSSDRRLESLQRRQRLLEKGSQRLRRITHSSAASSDVAEDVLRPEGGDGGMKLPIIPSHPALSRACAT